jgi:phospholipid/cholesterol/gamma-HCH transport system permease protein
MTQTSQQFIKFENDKGRLICSGEWTLLNIATLQQAFAKLSLPKKSKLKIDGSGITTLDSAGAWLLSKSLVENGFQVSLQDFSEPHQQLLELVEKQPVSRDAIPRIAKLGWFARVGKSASAQWDEFLAYLAFVGNMSIESLRLIARPKQFRWRALANILYTTGYQALPIIALLSFMIGVVIAYQMGNQLRTYGANILIVDFLGLSILREFGPLITSIMVAGRTGSSYTAELGTMKINQEIDALNTMGVTPQELLLLPRIIGLFIALPLLAMWADIFGIIGGMVMAKTILGISPYDFLVRFQNVIPVRMLIIGLGKAPIFALIIASIGCFQGERVELSSDSVGKKTTRSVVLSIFFIIVADALFSIIFSRMKL